MQADVFLCMSRFWLIIYTKYKVVFKFFLPNINAFVEARFIASDATFGRWECKTR